MRNLVALSVAERRLVAEEARRAQGAVAAVVSSLVGLYLAQLIAVVGR